MSIRQLSLEDGQGVEVRIDGPDDGRPVLYFHSPSTSGEEVSGTASDAARLSIRLITLRRPSIFCDEPSKFVFTVAEHAKAVVEELGLVRPALLGWSGGAPYALAAAARLGLAIDVVHLVSPLPGPLTGPDAVPGQSARLRQVAGTTTTSAWATDTSTLRDYQAVAGPWTFDLKKVSQQVTIWAPTDDEIVPLRLAQHLAGSLPNSVIVEVPGAHDWMIQNWSTVLEQCTDPRNG